MPSDLPSKKQQAMLEFISDFIAANSYGPSYREIAKGLDYKSISTVAAHVDGLLKKGYLEKPDQYSARSLRLKTTTANKSDKDVALAYIEQRQADFHAQGNQAAADSLKKAIQLLDQSQA